MRYSITSEKLNSLMLLYAQNDITIEIDYNDVINNFAMPKAHLLYKYNGKDSGLRNNQDAENCLLPLLDTESTQVMDNGKILQRTKVKKWKIRPEPKQAR
ncbi:hypothetical protein TNCV_4938551 [Trichonephila clavipes]|nr:hypothetical protein TNCV_4938551 [Trichonephila clavipes]